MGAHAPPFGTEQARNAEVYSALSARSYSDAAHISLWITASCPTNIEHSNLQLPRDSFCGSASNTKPDSEGKGLRETTIRTSESTELLSSCHIFCMDVAVSDGLRSILIWSKFQNFPWGACPQTFLQHCVLYAHRQLHATHAAQPPTLCMYVPPFFNLWIRPCTSEPDLSVPCWMWCGHTATYVVDTKALS